MPLREQRALEEMADGKTEAADSPARALPTSYASVVDEYRAGREPIERQATLVLVAAGGFFLRLLGLNLTGTSDMFSWEAFANAAHSVGSVAAMASIPSDYPPLFFYLSETASLLFGPLTRQGIKVLLLAVELLLLAALLWDGNRLSRRYGRFSSLLIYVANPAIILNATMLGYLDIIPSALGVGALICLRKGRVFCCGFLFGLASLAKWQPNILLPLIATWLIAWLYVSGSWTASASLWPAIKRVALGGLGYLIAVGLLLLPFVLSGSLAPVLASLRFALGHSAFSQFQLNPGWLVIVALNLTGATKVGMFGFSVIGTPYEGWRWVFVGSFAIFTAVILASSLRYVRSTRRAAGQAEDGTLLQLVTYSLLLGFWGYVVFGFSVHENHLAPIVPVACLLALWNRRYLPLYVAISVMLFFNQYMFYGAFGEPLPGGRGLVWVALSVILSLFNVAALLYFTRDFLRICWRRPALPS